MKNNNWLRRRSYKHLDRPVSDAFVTRIQTPSEVAKHGFLPLLHYEKKTKRYRPAERKTTEKSRPIMFASHHDACILSYYSAQLSKILDKYYEENELQDCVVAYRSPGRSNYELSAEALRFANQSAPCTLLAFDVSGFFDGLKHSLLKRRLKGIVGKAELPPDWYAVYKYVTQYHFINRDDLKAHPVFGQRMARREPIIATISEVKAAGIKIQENKTPGVGIPQGTPISAALSNLYMMDFDLSAKAYCDSIGALYRRYSDDILVVCPTAKSGVVESQITALVVAEKLKINAAKTEKVQFDPGNPTLALSRPAQYLGFAFYPGGAGIRPPSLARQWRKMRRNAKRVKRAAEASIAAGEATKVFTKKLRKRFAPLQFRNFSSYGRRSATSFGEGQKIKRQLGRIERALEREILELKKLET